jgi:hypothetical protein
MKAERLAKGFVRAVGGYWLFDLCWDDRRRDTKRLPSPVLCSSWPQRLWWGDEASPIWLNGLMSMVRRIWYLGRLVTCGCPGCSHQIPMWWSTPLCDCCGVKEECCHQEDEW